MSFNLRTADLIVVGAGFFGATIAQLAAKKLGLRTLVIDRRDHVGGNAFNELDNGGGIEIHRCGAHIFHTSNRDIWDYVRQFGASNEYRHRVYAEYGNRIHSLPINLGTICQFFDRAFSPDEARDDFPSIGRTGRKSGHEPRGTGDIAHRTASP